MRVSFILHLSAVVLMAAGLGACSPSSVNFPLTVTKEMVLKTPSAATAVAWSPDGSRLAAAIDYGSTIAIWDSSGHPLSRFDVGSYGPSLGRSLAFLDGSSQILVEFSGAGGGDSAATVLDVASGKLVRSFDGPNPGAGPYNHINGFNVSPDQQSVVLAMYDAGPQGIDVAIMDAADDKFVRGYKLSKGALKMNMFANGQQLIVGTIDGIFAILDATTVGPVREFQSAEDTQATRGAVAAVAGSPDGNLIFLGQEARDVVGAHVLRVADGARIANFPLAPNQTISLAEWDPQGRYVAFLDSYEGLVLWRPLATRPPSYEKVATPPQSMSFAIAPDGSRIAVAEPTGVVIYSVH